jgi:hypothetical protein
VKSTNAIIGDVILNQSNGYISYNLDMFQKCIKYIYTNILYLIDTRILKKLNCAITTMTKLFGRMLILIWMLCCVHIEMGDAVKAMAAIKAVNAGLDAANKGVDLMKKVSGAVMSAINAPFNAVAQRPKSLMNMGDLAAIKANMDPGTAVTFQNLPGFDGVEEFEPAGWEYKVEGPHKRKEDEAEEPEPVFAYPMGVGNYLMSGCFGSGYQPGDPCYENLRFKTRCAEQIDSANFIGVGYDITKTYSSESRKKSVVQRVCAGKAQFLGKDVPDNMNAYGVYDYSIWTKSFQSATQYKEFLTKKSGIKMSAGTFAEEQKEWQSTKSKIHGKYRPWSGYSGGMSGVSVGGASESQVGIQSSESMTNQANSQSKSNSNSFLAVLEADIKLYEIALDSSTPTDLSSTFVKDFIALPTSYYKIGADIKLQDFVLRYGTHYVKSAKFGGKLDVFKKSTVDSKMSQSQFASTAETEFSSMMATLKSSFRQSEEVKAKVNAWTLSGSATKSRQEENQSSGEKNEQSRNTAEASKSGNQQSSRSEFIETTIQVVGGEPEIAASIMEFYTPAFKGRFLEWLKSIQDYEKPYEMTFGPIPKLFDVDANSLFYLGKPTSGCFGDDVKEVEEGSNKGKRYYVANETSIDPADNSTITVSRMVFCPYSNNFEEAKETFMKDFKARRLALERAISIYMNEGPFSTSSYEIPAGEVGCESETLDYIHTHDDSSRTWPTADEIKNKEFKIYFLLPYDMPMMHSDQELEVKLMKGYWYTMFQDFVTP